MNQYTIFTLHSMNSLHNRKQEWYYTLLSILSHKKVRKECLIDFEHMICIHDYRASLYILTEHQICPAYLFRIKSSILHEFTKRI